MRACTILHTMWFLVRVSKFAVDIRTQLCSAWGTLTPSDLTLRTTEWLPDMMKFWGGRFAFSSKFVRVIIRNATIATVITNVLPLKRNRVYIDVLWNEFHRYPLLHFHMPFSSIWSSSQQRIPAKVLVTNKRSCWI